MLDQEFLEYLEYQICKAFENSVYELTRTLWCDGILLNEQEYSYLKKRILESEQIVLKAFIGKDGQSEYELILKFGSKALTQIERNLDIKECVHNPHKTNWFDLDTKQKIIVIQLD